MSASLEEKNWHGAESIAGRTAEGGMIKKYRTQIHTDEHRYKNSKVGMRKWEKKKVRRWENFECGIRKTEVRKKEVEKVGR
jgi:hypothetical protein